MLGVIAASLEKIATEIRHLQRTEVREAAEPFARGAAGLLGHAAQAQPDPLRARLRAGAPGARLRHAGAGERGAWHERDISHSSAERVILPDACIALDYALDLLTGVLRGLRVDAERMRANVDMTGGLIFSQRALLALIDKGMGRQDAYKIVQESAMQAWREGAPVPRVCSPPTHSVSAVPLAAGA